MTLKQDLVQIAVDSVEIKIDLNKICVGLIDQVIEPALEKVVMDSANPFDNAAKSMLYPLLEKEVKTLLAKEIIKIEAAIAAKIAALKA